MHPMICLAFLFTLMPSAKGSVGTPWYPVMVPVHAGGNRHTTHVVTHPVVRTRVLVLGGEDERSHHQGDDHQRRKYATPQHGRYSERDPTTSSRVADGGNWHSQHGGHSYDEEDAEKNDYDFHSQPEVIRYSMLVSESPWKPLVGRIPNYVAKQRPRSQDKEPPTMIRWPERRPQNHRSAPPASHHRDIPEGYLPLRYLGLDGEKVARVVEQAINEIDKDMQTEGQHRQTTTSRPRYPTGIQDLIGRSRVVMNPPALTAYPGVVKTPLPAMYRGAVLYDDVLPKARYLHTGPAYVSNYPVAGDPSRKNALKLNVECQCQAPY